MHVISVAVDSVAVKVPTRDITMPDFGVTITVRGNMVLRFSQLLTLFYQL